MTALSDYLENKLYNEVLRNTDYVPPAAVYVALFTTATSDDGSGTEVTGGSYARQAVTFAAPSNGAASNNAACTFPQATGNWGTITHFALMDASTGGNMLLHGPLTASKTVNSGDVFTFPASSLTVTFS
jgi:hypothetical protein